jgi:hypothetical protein
MGTKVPKKCGVIGKLNRELHSPAVLDSSWAESLGIYRCSDDSRNGRY